jgi:hypothetical protein
VVAEVLAYIYRIQQKTETPLRAAQKEIAGTS